MHGHMKESASCSCFTLLLGFFTEGFGVGAMHHSHPWPLVQQDFEPLLLRLLDPPFLDHCCMTRKDAVQDIVPAVYLT